MVALYLSAHSFIRVTLYYQPLVVQLVTISISEYALTISLWFYCDY